MGNYCVRNFQLSWTQTTWIIHWDGQLVCPKLKTAERFRLKWASSIVLCHFEINEPPPPLSMGSLFYLPYYFVHMEICISSYFFAGWIYFLELCPFLYFMYMMLSGIFKHDELACFLVLCKSMHNVLEYESSYNFIKIIINLNGCSLCIFSFRKFWR